VGVTVGSGGSAVSVGAGVGDEPVESGVSVAGRNGVGVSVDTSLGAAGA